MLRAHTGRASVLRLAPKNARGDRPGPDWARFPRLRGLVLSWGRQDEPATLRGLFPSGPSPGTEAAVLAGVEELRVRDFQTELGLRWAAVLWHSPAVKRIELDGRVYGAEQMVMFSTIASPAASDDAGSLGRAAVLQDHRTAVGGLHHHYRSYRGRGLAPAARARRHQPARQRGRAPGLPPAQPGAA